MIKYIYNKIYIQQIIYIDKKQSIEKKYIEKTYIDKMYIKKTYIKKT